MVKVVKGVTCVSLQYDVLSVLISRHRWNKDPRTCPGIASGRSRKPPAHSIFRRTSSHGPLRTSGVSASSLTLLCTLARRSSAVPGKSGSTMMDLAAVVASLEVLPLLETIKAADAFWLVRVLGKSKPIEMKAGRVSRMKGCCTQEELDDGRFACADSSRPSRFSSQYLQVRVCDVCSNIDPLTTTSSSYQRPRRPPRTCRIRQKT